MIDLANERIRIGKTPIQLLEHLLTVVANTPSKRIDLGAWRHKPHWWSRPTYCLGGLLARDPLFQSMGIQPAECGWPELIDEPYYRGYTVIDLLFVDKTVAGNCFAAYGMGELDDEIFNSPYIINGVHLGSYKDSIKLSHKHLLSLRLCEQIRLMKNKQYIAYRAIWAENKPTLVKN